MARRLEILFVALALIVFIPFSAFSEEKSLIFYILDGSGSMWGRVDGKIKIQVAKDVMSTLVKETPDGIEWIKMRENQLDLSSDQKPHN